MMTAIRSNTKYDIAIIGAGPVGIFTSIKLAVSGFRVLVIEEDPQVGKPRFCTGLISKEAFEQFDLPRESIEGEFDSAFIFSPLGSRARLKGKDIQAYVTDRAIFDQGLWRKAHKAGVDFLLNCRCLGLKINDSRAEATISIDGGERIIKSEVVVLTTGIKYGLHLEVGLAKPPNFLDCSQVEAIGDKNGGIEIFVGNSVAPQSFAWVVPLTEDKLRIGLSTYKDSSRFLGLFLKSLVSKGRIRQANFEIVRRPVPMGVINKTYACRTLAVGDAAGQVKPTTGGGIYFGLLCADLAAKTIREAFKKGNFSEKFLGRYESSWKKKISFDLTMGLYLRSLVANLNDEQIERLVQFCSQEAIQALIEKYADFNHHGRFIRELIKRPYFWKTLHQVLTAK